MGSPSQGSSKKMKRMGDDDDDERRRREEKERERQEKKLMELQADDRWMRARLEEAYDKLLEVAKAFGMEAPKHPKGDTAKGYAFLLLCLAEELRKKQVGDGIGGSGTHDDGSDDNGSDDDGSDDDTGDVKTTAPV